MVQFQGSTATSMFSGAVIKADRKKRRPLRMYATRKLLDRDSDVIIPEGLRPHLARFEASPRLLFNHNDFELPPLGRFENVEIDEEAVTGEPVFVTPKMFPDVNHEWLEFANMIGEFLQGDILNTGSIRFIPHKSDTENPIFENQKGRTISEWEMLEYSIVNIPALPEASTVAQEAARYKSVGRFAKLLQLDMDPGSSRSIVQLPRFSFDSIQEVREFAKEWSPRGEGKQITGSFKGVVEAADDHTHTFLVEIEDDAVVMGATSEEDGHRHMITELGTTEEADGHRHAWTLEAEEPEADPDEPPPSRSQEQNSRALLELTQAVKGLKKTLAERPATAADAVNRLASKRVWEGN